MRINKTKSKNMEHYSIIQDINKNEKSMKILVTLRNLNKELEMKILLYG